jgi:hypothetical protein
VFELTSAARAELERLAWNGNPPVVRRGEPPTSGPIHQLATHDVFAAFLRASKPGAGEGLVAWIPERACRNVFDGFVRPDAIAGIVVGGRLIVLCIERDLGTERSEVLAAKIRRYQALARRGSGRPLTVGFVVDSRRRARTIHDLVRDGVRDGLRVVTAQLESLATDPLGSPWSDGRSVIRIGELSGVEVDIPLAPLAPLAPSCLIDRDALSALDDRGAGLLTQGTSDVRLHGMTYRTNSGGPLSANIG